MNKVVFNNPYFFNNTKRNINKVLSQKIKETTGGKTFFKKSCNFLESKLKARKVIITNSCTASLEIAKRNIPQIVIYKLNYFTEILIKPFVRVKYANLINIISNKMIIPEVVNSNLNEKKLLNIFINLFNDRKKQENQINSINMHLKEIVNDFSPYDVSVNRINKLINPSSKAN